MYEGQCYLDIVRISLMTLLEGDQFDIVTLGLYTGLVYTIL